MSNTAERLEISAEAYLQAEARSSVKHEYIAGEVFAMAGAQESHVTIALNIATLLRSHVRGSPCRVYISDMKVRVDAADSFFYPDVFVTCDNRDVGESLMKRHPNLIIEVLSKSTAVYDYSAKFGYYQQLESLQEYVLIKPERMAIDVFRRDTENQWVLYSFAAGDELTLTSIDFHCAIAALYEDVSLESADQIIV
ncbi:Uma2 family endonuclease [Chromatium okenii]|uniref:Uma2 family endonuclease n=1 Tax=Chromatium okenii TaxID=61644 RepID=UPI0026EEAF0E|nr:Uma2 family endonuclease [Chromatium okenii]MBV5309123.1 Uma2 family endonuclease [Chromatium okenii]